MIDIELLQKKFDEYVYSFDTTNEKNEIMIKRKINHSYRVMKNCKIIATNNNLNLEEINLATVIGLLHDIGRFKQQQIADTYNDSISKIDHAKLGSDILFKENKITDFLPNIRKYDRIIKVAIENHNKLTIEEGLNEKEILFCKIIRDADKLDLLFLNTQNLQDVLNASKSSNYIFCDKITDEFLENLFIHKQIPKKKLKYFLDWYLNILTFIFDINFDKSMEIILNRQYVEKIIYISKELFESKSEVLEKVKKSIYQYLNDNYTDIYINYINKNKN